MFSHTRPKSWTTTAVPLQIGVFQGDPLSADIFNANTVYIDAIKPHLTQSYKPNQSLSLLWYADDTCLVSNGPSSCKQMLRPTEAWLQWSGMKPKVWKCQYVAHEASRGRVFDPNLTLAGEKISFIGKEPVRFLSGTTQIPTDPHIARRHIQQRLATLMSRVDATAVTRKQKICLYKLDVCLRITRELTIFNLPLS